jgi:heme/copper-type cytochrome/quinol oxidase subunit 4
MFNVVVGIAWQVSLVALPIYVVIWKVRTALIALAIIAITSVVLKFTWYNHLRDSEAVDQLGAGSGAVRTLPAA